MAHTAEAEKTTSYRTKKHHQALQPWQCARQSDSSACAHTCTRTHTHTATADPNTPGAYPQVGCWRQKGSAAWACRSGRQRRAAARPSASCSEHTCAKWGAIEGEVCSVRVSEHGRAKGRFEKPCPATNPCWQPQAQRSGGKARRMALTALAAAAWPATRPRWWAGCR